MILWKYVPRSSLSKFHHGQLTFASGMPFREFLSSPFHDEITYGRGSHRKMPGDEWQRFANLRLLYGYMYGHPEETLFMEGIRQCREWCMKKA